MLGYHTNLQNLFRDHTLTSKFAISDQVCMQIFSSGPRSRQAIFNDQRENFLRESGIQVVMHGPYPMNPWGGSDVIIGALTREVQLAQRLDCHGLIIHASKKIHDDNAFRKVLLSVDRDIRDNNSCLWIETHCAKPCRESLETPQKITALWQRIEELHLSRLKVGICLDTAHIHSSGVTLDERSKTEQWLAGLPAQAPYMLHLNDSSRDCGSGQDEHASLFTGKIWGDYLQNPWESGVLALMSWATEKNMPVILERGVLWTGDNKYYPYSGAAKDLLNLKTIKVAGLL